jgi:hypothetical protein
MDAKYKKIKIRRAHIEGLLPCEGLLVEVHDFQFCFIYIDDVEYYYLIELKTGGSVIGLDANFYTKDDALQRCIDSISNRTKSQIEEATSKFILTHLELDFPVNEPI